MANLAEQSCKSEGKDAPEIDYSNLSANEEEDVNIGLVGDVGSGKSSFVNAIIMRYQDNDKKAATTGVTNTSTEPVGYYHPSNSNTILWELPGLNTPTYPDAKIYYEKLELKQYDAFLLFANERFTKDDLELAKRLHSAKKPFFIVWTKIDVDYFSEMKKNTYDEDKFLTNIIKNILEHTKDLGCSEEDIFLISNFHSNMWHFERLNDAVLNRLSYRQSTVGCLPFPSRKSKPILTRALEETEQQQEVTNTTLNSSSESTGIEKKIDKEAWYCHLKKHFKEVTDTIKEHGIKETQKLMKERLERWQDTEITLAVVGQSGSGKSSFINSIRGLNDDDPGGAATGVTETTMNPAEYVFPPPHSNIKLWDIPGIGTPNFPDLKTYCKKLNIEIYDTFIIMASQRFTNDNLLLAKKLVAINKPFFFVRAKIDENYRSEQKKKMFDEEKMLEKIRAECYNGLKEQIRHANDIFLISNNHPKKWDYPRLTNAISEKLSHRKKEAFCLSIYVLSKDILKRKVDTLKGRVWMVAIKSIITKAFTTESYSSSVDTQIILEKVEFYRSQLGFPKQGSKEFNEMTLEIQEQVKRFYLTDTMDIIFWLKKFVIDVAYDSSSSKPSDSAKSIEKPYKFVYCSLHCVLDAMYKIALNILGNATERQDQDNDIL